jgi:hypothetical protein
MRRRPARKKRGSKYGLSLSLILVKNEDLVMLDKNENYLLLGQYILI